MSRVTIILLIMVVLCALLGGALLLYELDARKVPGLAVTVPAILPGITVTAQAAQTQTASSAPTAQPVETPTPAPSATPAPVPSPPPSLTPTQKPNGDSVEPKPNTLTIRGKSIPFKDNIGEDTLKKNVGWMATSARPGEPGICVIMGHRNGKMRVLKDVEYGDVITVTDGYGASHAYTVTRGEIIAGGPVAYEPTGEKTLCLLTCYPFYYSGSAPHQYLVTAVGQ